MTVDQFKASLSWGMPPPDLSPVLAALWHDGRGDWGTAHAVAQDIPGPGGAWVHAYLHRKEGDLTNASYWYRRAGRSPAAGPLEDEWEQLVTTFVAGQPA